MIMAATSHPQALLSCQKGTIQNKSRGEKGGKNCNGEVCAVRSVSLTCCSGGSLFTCCVFRQWWMGVVGHFRAVLEGSIS